jgi:hypothetical protein
MIQEIVVSLIFIGALAYLGRLLYNQFQAKSACASGCNKCTAVDFNKIEAALKEKKF